MSLTDCLNTKGFLLLRVQQGEETGENFFNWFQFDETCENFVIINIVVGVLQVTRTYHLEISCIKGPKEYSRLMCSDNQLAQANKHLQLKQQWPLFTCPLTHVIIVSKQFGWSRMKIFDAGKVSTALTTALQLMLQLFTTICISICLLI